MASGLGIGLSLLVSLAALACLVVVWVGATLDYQPEPSQLTDFELTRERLGEEPERPAAGPASAETLYWPLLLGGMALITLLTL